MLDWLTPAVVSGPRQDLTLDDTAPTTDREAIWRDTGWYQGPEGKWKFEIPDDAAKIKGGTLPASEVKIFGENLGKHESWKIGDQLEHQQLYSAYPELASIDASFQKGGSSSYRPGWVSYSEDIASPVRSEAQAQRTADANKALREYVNSPKVKAFDEVMDKVVDNEAEFNRLFQELGGKEIKATRSALARAANEAHAAPGIGKSLGPRAKSVTLHELQHAIQEREGFARGGNQESAANTASELMRKVEKRIEI